MPTDRRLELGLAGLDDTEYQRLLDCMKVHGATVDTVVSAALRIYLRFIDSATTQQGTCPKCDPSAKGTAPLIGLSMLDAESMGFLPFKLGAGMREWAKNHGTLYVGCPKCLWWGHPDSE